MNFCTYIDQYIGNLKKKGYVQVCHRLLVKHLNKSMKCKNQKISWWVIQKKVAQLPG